MKKEELLALGLSEEQAAKVMKEYGDMVPQARLKEITSEVHELKNELSKRDNQLKELGKSVKDNEELTQKIKELQVQNETNAKEYEANLSKLKLDNAIELALTSNGAKNNKALKSLLDLDKIKFENDKLVGLDEQITSLKTSDGYLFNSKETPTLPNGVNPKIGNSKLSTKSLEEMSYDELAAYYGSQNNNN